MADTSNETQRQSQLATARLLRELLISQPRYRRQWAERAHRVSVEDLSQAAVAEVIALHLWETGEKSDADVMLARRLRDRVRRALNGSHLSAETLTWFISAFDMDEAHEHQLWAAYAGGGRIDDGGIVNTIQIRRAMAKRQWHRTLALFERYYVAADGALISRHSMHTIVAIEDGVDSYLYNHEPFANSIEVIHGGTLGRRYEYGNGLTANDIVFDRPLRTGQSISLEYRTNYLPGSRYVTEVRRPARARTSNVDIALQFDSQKVPSRTWWCVWADHLEGEPVSAEPMSLDNNHSVHRFVPFIEQTVVGFRWEW